MPIRDEVEDIGTWQIELRKAKDDPMELDQIILHVSLASAASPEHLVRVVEERFLQISELRPNAIRLHTEQGMRKLHGVGTALKEERIVDNRPASKPAPTRPVIKIHKTTTPTSPGRTRLKHRRRNLHSTKQ